MRPPEGKTAGGAGLWAGAALLATATFLLYSRVAGHQFLYYDDDQYVTANPWVRQGLSWAGARWAVTALAAANWHPLTWLSHMADVELFGLNPSAHHLMNAGLHAGNAALLFAVLVRMTGARWRSGLVAALFAVHPLHVESVAWVSERKDVLSTFFGFLMLWVYAWHAKRPRAARLAAVSLCFALSLLAKPMWVTAPFLLLLLDVWPLRRLEGAPVTFRGASRLIGEKLPLFALSGLSCAATLIAQKRGGALIPIEAVGFAPRLANALVSYARYLGKTVWPTSLAALYPYPRGGVSPWQAGGAAALLALLTLLALSRARERPWLAVGWLWFMGTLVPVIGLVQVGSQAMADRYTYLPLVGLFLALAWEAGELAARPPGVFRTAVPLGVAAVLIALSAVTWRQLGYWADQETLFRHALAVTEPNGRAHLILSQALAERSAFGEALVHAEEAARLDPLNPRAFKNLGFILYRLGRVDQAIGEFQRAIALQPDYAEAHGNLGIAYGRKGWVEAAMREMSQEAALRAAQSAR